MPQNWHHRKGSGGFTGPPIHAALHLVSGYQNAVRLGSNFRCTSFETDPRSIYPEDGVNNDEGCASLARVSCQRGFSD